MSMANFWFQLKLKVIVKPLSASPWETQAIQGWRDRCLQQCHNAASLNHIIEFSQELTFTWLANVTSAANNHHCFSQNLLASSERWKAPRSVLVSRSALELRSAVVRGYT